MEKIIKQLEAITHNGKAPVILTECGPDKVEYEKKRQIFRLRSRKTII